jgi:CRP/FNR family transcriptional regulator
MIMRELTMKETGQNSETEDCAIHQSVRNVQGLARSSAETCGSCDSRSSSVCNAIEDADLARLAAVANPIRVEPGRAFINEGDPADSFFNMTGGTATLYKLLPDGRRQITGFARSGDFLGLAVSSTYAFTAEAIDTVKVCRFGRRKMMELLDDFPAMERRLLDRASNELVAAQEQMLLLGRKTARERLASFLLSQFIRTRKCEHDSSPIDLPMTRSDIADYLGLTIETVSRTFTRLRKEGTISLPSTDQVILLDRERLEEMADGSADED